MSVSHRRILSTCTLLLAMTPLPVTAQTGSAATPSEARVVAPEAWLLNQLYLGEARHNEALVDQALDRLEAIAPDDSQVLEARVRRALRRNEPDEAARLVGRLAQLAPNSDAYRRARLNLSLLQPERRAALGQARLLAAAGRLDEAQAAYDALFADGLPTLPLALEYWQLVARQPGGEERAIRALQTLDERYPRSPELGFALARLLFAADRDSQAIERLERLASDPGSRAAAARQWRDALRGEPPSEASVAAWQRFLRNFDDSDYADEARTILAQHRQLLADPAYQARRRGLARFEAQGGSTGEADLERALATYPDDVEVLGALGVIRLRQGRHADALALFQRAQTLDTSGFSGNKWRSLIATARYWRQLRLGDAALATGDLTRAEQAYRRAAGLDPTAPLASIGLGDVARQRGDSAAAQRAYHEALRRAPDSAAALERLAALYAEQSPARGLAFIEGLPPAQRRLLSATRTRLQIAELRAEGERLADEADWEAAFAALLPRLTTAENRAQGHYAQALYLASTDRNGAALESLAAIPPAQRDDDMRALATRLERSEVLARAERLRDAGDAAAARALLDAQPPASDIALRLGDWAMERGDSRDATRRYREALSLAPESQDARLGLVEAALARGDDATARRAMADLAPAADDLSARRRQANAWAALGETTRAERLMDALLAGPTGNDALLLRDAARIATARGDDETALERYRRAMTAAELADTATLASDAGFTHQMRTRQDDDWLASSLRSEAAEHYRAQNTQVRSARQVQNDSGTEGVSSLTATTDMLEADTPLGKGRGFLRLDRVTLDAGRLERDADGRNRDAFGTCAVVGCANGFHQQDRGMSVGLGWYDETWRLDIGTTPLGFAVSDWVGGLQYRGDIGPLWLTATLSRRPLNDSLLAFAGTRDPRTGTTWGGVRASGLSLGLGYDQGGPIGVWSNFGVHHLAGENVPDNRRSQLMGGVYRKLINRAHERLSVGLSALTMHYEKELGGYTLGQGGYYSPQRYASVALPVNYARRSGNWSWLIEAAVSQSWTDSDASRRYPLGGTALEGLPDAGAIRSGDNGGGFGYSLGGRIERRLGDHWTAGLGFSLQQAEDYAPNTISFTLRYGADAWQGDLAMPPEALTPYAEFD